MEKLINFFKSIWNFFFKYENDGSGLTTVTFKRNENTGEFELKDEAKKETVAAKPKVNTAQFSRQQLIGKVCKIGRHYYRIKKKLGMTDSEKLRYEITQL